MLPELTIGKHLLLGIGVAILLAMAVRTWHARHTTFADVQSREIAIYHSELEAVKALLAEAGLEPGQMRVVEMRTGESCRAAARWNAADRWLRVYRRFGTFPGRINCLGIDGGHVVSLSIVDSQLADMRRVAHLPELRRLYLNGNRIERLAGVGSKCPWTHLNLASNAVMDISSMTACTQLEDLDISHNRLSMLPPLQGLDRLGVLNAGNNELRSAGAVAGHSSLRRLFLSGNRLETPEGLHAMPLLESLSLNENRLTTLVGLKSLPALRRLHVASNRLATVETEIVEAFPALRDVSLGNNHVHEKPAGFVYAGGGGRSVTLRRADGRPPKLNLSMNPVADVIEQEARAQHDGTTTHHVDRLPRGRGRWMRPVNRLNTRNGFSIAHVDARGTAAWLDGASSVTFDLIEAPMVKATASVEVGRLRVYLTDPAGGYRYAEAVAGEPARLNGRLITMGKKPFIYFESAGGRAEGVTWSVSG